MIRYYILIGINNIYTFEITRHANEVQSRITKLTLGPGIQITDKLSLLDKSQQHPIDRNFLFINHKYLK